MGELLNSKFQAGVTGVLKNNIGLKRET